MFAKRRGNPNWGKPEVSGLEISPTLFERAVEELKLTPDQYVHSAQLREWARLNKNSKFVPETLLAAWGFVVDSSF
jgi:hypothetical protein